MGIVAAAPIEECLDLLKTELEEQGTLLNSAVGPRIREATKSVGDAWGTDPEGIDMSLIDGVELNKSDVNKNNIVHGYTHTEEFSHHGVAFELHEDHLILFRRKLQEIHGQKTIYRASGEVETSNYKDGVEV
jgi:hypothetical protein